MSVIKVTDWSKFKCKSLNRIVHLGEKIMKFKEKSL